MVGKIRQSDGTLRIDWSTLRKNSRTQKFIATLVSRQSELEKTFKTGTKVKTTGKYYHPPVYASEEVAKKLRQLTNKYSGQEIQENVRFDPKHEAFVVQTLDESALIEFFNSGHEFVVIRTRRINYLTVVNVFNVTTQVNFYEDKEWVEEIQKNGWLFVTITLFKKQGTTLFGKDTEIEVPCECLQIIETD